MDYFRRLFSFEGRIERTEYLTSLITIIFLISIISEFIEVDNYKMVGLGYIPSYWILWAQGAKRCHDLGKSGWYQIVPFYVLWMMFEPGNIGINKYGVK